MASEDLALGTIFLLQTIVGFLGNFCLLHHYLFLYYKGCRLRSTDLILKHLIVANSLVILSRGVPQTMAALGLKDFLNDFGCKFIFYLHRVGRDVSIGTTCLLSVFQAIIISPWISKWAELKKKVTKHIGTSNILCWILTMMLDIMVPVYVTDKWSNKNSTKKKDYGYCYVVIYDKITYFLYVPLLLFHDVLCLGLMLWASSSMVFILYRHRQRVQRIHKTNISSRTSPESTATQSILVLVCTFVSLSTLSSIFHTCSAVYEFSLWLVNTSTLLAACFPTVSPYILMSHDSRVSRLCFA
ncbi:PREDICTED: vomeronasal type-1 receptor 4-like [Ceratotherium simum simum]|uniref:Vomeronasal type-1 receptor n=1 Tax=Ceratotherium simum simum TaxID=73337 RepID=A0ABM1DDC4_CERSS|nr:PREDICTED: vomeronasal type-1 receptor 4-like [Ceratotherium simum simum]